MSDDGFVELSRYGLAHPNDDQFVTVSDQSATTMSRAARRRIGAPARIVIEANPKTGDVRLRPTDSTNGNSVKLTVDGQFTGRLARFCKAYGFQLGRNPAEITDGMVVFRLQRKENS